MNPTLQRAIDLLARFPGIGKKTAQRLAFFLVNQQTDYVESLAQAILDLKQSLNVCQTCFNLSDQTVCPICRDMKRDTKVICVVEDSPSLAQIERSAGFHGRYHVLQGVLSPVQGIGPSELRIRPLLERLKEEACSEVILATSPTVEGEATALYIAELLEATPIKVTRIASGVPAGSSLDYIDDVTLKKAIEHRREM